MIRTLTNTIKSINQTIIDEHSYTANALGEALAFACLQGNWKPKHIGHYAVILINSNGEHAVVSDASFKEIKWNVIRLKTDNYPIERELSSLNEVFKFLNQDFESLK